MNFGMVTGRSERVPPREARPHPAEQTDIATRVVKRIVLRNGPQTAGRPKIGSVQTADDTKSSILVADAKHYGKDLVAGDVGMDAAIDINVEIIQPILGVEQMFVDRPRDFSRGAGKVISASLYSSPIFCAR